ncbi:33848_t:CDS:1, partial [Racocetra persica]
ACKECMQFLESDIKTTWSILKYGRIHALFHVIHLSLSFLNIGLYEQ